MTYSRNFINFISILTLSFCCFIISGCSSQKKLKSTTYTKLSKDDPQNMKYRGCYKIGKKYKIKRKTYYPKKVKKYNKVGMASWYGKRYGFHGRKTANGDIYNSNLLTAAHPTLQLPCLVKVTNLSNKKSVIVMVNDRGPFAAKRIIDLSEKAASVIGMKRKGTAKVKVQYLKEDSEKLLRDFGLKERSGSRAKRMVLNKKCSINCHIKLVNLKHKTSFR